MKQKVTNLLQFNELNKDQQERVTDQYRLINVEDYRDFYKVLSDTYDELTSDELVIETLLCNSYHFNEETLKIDS